MWIIVFVYDCGESGFEGIDGCRILRAGAVGFGEEVDQDCSCSVGSIVSYGIGAIDHCEGFPVATDGGGDLSEEEVLCKATAKESIEEGLNRGYRDQLEFVRSNHS